MILIFKFFFFADSKKVKKGNFYNFFMHTYLDGFIESSK